MEQLTLNLGQIIWEYLADKYIKNHKSNDYDTLVNEKNVCGNGKYLKVISHETFFSRTNQQRQQLL